jgi:hypothetical protein
MTMLDNSSRLKSTSQERAPSAPLWQAGSMVYPTYRSSLRRAFIEAQKLMDPKNAGSKTRY